MLKWAGQFVTFVKEHKKSLLISLVIFFILCIISHIMTIHSIAYRPLNSIFRTSPTLSHEVKIPYKKSTTYNESLSLPSMAFSTISSVNESFSTFMDVVDLASYLNAVNGQSGTLIIPANASYEQFGDNQIYGWKKECAYCFNQIPHVEVSLVFVTTQYAISIQFGGDVGLFTQMGLYQLI